MSDTTSTSQNIVKMLDKIKQNRVYGSLEIYFEDGQVTQVTQRIINKFKAERKEIKQQRSAKQSLKSNDTEVTTSRTL